MFEHYLNSLASLGTLLVVGVTAVIALGQLSHLRASNQLDGLIHCLEWRESEVMQDSDAFVRTQLPEKMRDPEYRKELALPTVDRRVHKELAICDWIEQTGSYIKYELITEEQYLDLNSDYVEQMWATLKTVVAIRRAARSQAMYENFEYLAARAQRWTEKHSAGNYPVGTPRLLSPQDCHAIAQKMGTTERVTLH